MKNKFHSLEPSHREEPVKQVSRPELPVKVVLNKSLTEKRRALCYIIKCIIYIVP